MNATPPRRKASHSSDAETIFESPEVQYLISHCSSKGIVHFDGSSDPPSETDERPRRAPKGRRSTSTAKHGAYSRNHSGVEQPVSKRYYHSKQKYALPLRRRQNGQNSQNGQNGQTHNRVTSTMTPGAIVELDASKLEMDFTSNSEQEQLIDQGDWTADVEELFSDDEYDKWIRTSPSQTLSEPRRRERQRLNPRDIVQGERNQGQTKEAYREKREYKKEIENGFAKLMKRTVIGCGLREARNACWKRKKNCLFSEIPAGRYNFRQLQYFPRADVAMGGNRL